MVKVNGLLQSDYQVASKHGDVQMADFVESEFLGEQVVINF